MEGVKYQKDELQLQPGDEIYSNILRYSDAEYATVSCILEEESVKLVFRDNGMEYNPLAKEDPYEYVEGQNVLTVTFTLV